MVTWFLGLATDCMASLLIGFHADLFPRSKVQVVMELDGWVLARKEVWLNRQPMVR